MPSFVAADVVESLDYDFTKFKGGKGTIPEPSDEAIGAFQKSLTAEMKRVAEVTGVQDAATATPGEFLGALERTQDDDMLTGTLRRQAGIYSDLCSGKPSEADILKLPFRYRLGFFRWVSEQVMNPEVMTGAGNSQGPTRLSAVAG